MWYQDADLECAHRAAEAEPGSAEGHPDFCRYAYSHDGVQWVEPKLGLRQHGGSAQNNIWHRPHDRAWFIERGPAGAFDDGWVLGASGLVMVGTEMWFYYGAQQLQHTPDLCPQMSVGLAKLTRDWFMSQQAGTEPGYLLSREVVIEGSRLELNCFTFQQGATKTDMAELGEITVELVESLPAKEVIVGGRPIPGFSFAECDPVRGRGLAKTVTWQGRSDLSELRGRPVHLRFRLQIANLFTFAFRD